MCVPLRAVTASTAPRLKRSETKARKRRPAEGAVARRAPGAGGCRERKRKGLEGPETLSRASRAIRCRSWRRPRPRMTTHHPVEPELGRPGGGAAELAARCRLSCLRRGNDGAGPEAFAASLAPAGSSCDASAVLPIRPGHRVPPHSTKPARARSHDGRETSSGMVLYLNGDDPCRRPRRRRDDVFPPAATETSRKPRFYDSRGRRRASDARQRACARARAALFFPHGTVSGCFESLLHEGSAMRGTPPSPAHGRVTACRRRDDGSS